MRFADAAKDYAHLYELAYRDPQWMVKVAELQARMGRRAESLTALKQAVIGARTETASADFEIARYLETWGYIDDAVEFIQRGAARDGAELFIADKNRPDATTYARIIARARRMNDVLAHLEAGRSFADAAGRVVAEYYTPAEKLAFASELAAHGDALTPAQRAIADLPLAASAGLHALEARWRLRAMANSS